jgi:sugar phosphate isomerase/epimerase
MKTTGPGVTPPKHGLTRRGFLRAAGGLALCSLLPLACQTRDARPAGLRERLALSSVMFSELSLEDFCGQAAQLGFKGIDLWSPFGKCRHLAEAKDLGARRWNQLLARHGLQAGAYTTYRTKGHDEGFPGYAEFIGAAGGGVVVRESQYGTFAADELEASLRKFFDALRPEIELARKHRVRLAIENHSDALLDSLASFQLFTKLNPAPDVVGIALAIYHLQVRKVAVEDVIRACGSQLRFVYAWQQGRGLAQLPGHGPADFGPWLRALRQQGYTGWITPFMHGERPVAEMAAAVRKACHYLESAESAVSESRTTGLKQINDLGFGSEAEIKLGFRS